ncbi:Crp/Fnr family transcriptional regulator [Campylobacter fetus]|uniref:Crp/Fnr family transcriptional regulator n=1 Tax=Campylobacter fetus TaxID=196 RepID=UPI0003C2AE72|nr:Crp/Fnr family transcriptional regulator [Campylobacter fetus]AGZ81657.1 putative nitrosative stress-response regulator NssR, Crp/Fnr family [Campylobacter fetus subsp. testudinum 03-427]AJB45396.1 transcriptional regulator [Campylobacter fetus subsp. testudinum]ALV64813.1 putative nitrosative stress-response regulator NssR, Crp/Fnr family [Campylobacter fetus subsp. testudinum Sp3]AVK81063.1 Crp/Fnr family transcriptional regulator [Campylobacter fetus subsp. testudinum]EAI4321365.1 Crp/Fn
MVIKEIPFFSGLNDEDLKKLENISVIKSYKKDEFLFMEGDEPQWFNVLLKGTIKIYKSTPKGKEIFLHTLRPVSLVAELVNFENIPYPASGIFLNNAEVLRINYNKFKTDFLSNPSICFELLKSLSQKLKIMNGVLQNELTLKSDAKVAKFIVENPDLFSTIKHTQIASILNIAPETLSRTISQFKQQGIIKLDDNLNLTFKDNEKLISLFNI